MTPLPAVYHTRAKAAPRSLRLNSVRPPRSPRRPTGKTLTMHLTRRAALSLALLPVVPASIRAQTDGCVSLSPGLQLCDARGWTLLPGSTNGSFHLLSANGIVGAVTLTPNLTPDQVSGARWTISHMPISARANVLSTGFIEISGHSGTTVAYLPRHADPVMVVALSDVIGSDFTLVVSSHETGIDAYSPLHQEDHAALLAALRLDIAR